MIVPPIPVGLHLCEGIEFDPASKTYSVRGILPDRWPKRIPSDRYVSLIAYAPVTGGRGEGVLELEVREFHGEFEGQLLYRQTRWLKFTEPIDTHHLEIRVTKLAFRRPGQHVFRLLFGNILITERSFFVVPEE